MSTIKTSFSSLTPSQHAVLIKNRDDVKSRAHVRVRFGSLKERNLKSIIYSVLDTENFTDLDEYLMILEKEGISDEDLLILLKEIRSFVHLLQPKFGYFVRKILDLKCLLKNDEIVSEYQQFLIDLLTAHNKYTPMIVKHLVSVWVLEDTDSDKWINDKPNEELEKILNVSIKLLCQLVDLIPMAFDIMLETIESMFPFYKRPSHVLSCYVHHIIQLIEIKQNFEQDLFQVLLTKLVVLDTNVSRNDIEDAECEVEEMEVENENLCMHHSIAETLDICLYKFILYLDKKFAVILTNDSNSEPDVISNDKFFKLFLFLFRSVIIPSHNPYHVQYIIFYICNFKQRYAEQFLKELWHNVRDPNVVPNIRQTSISYIGSFLARANFIPLQVIKTMLNEMCVWAHQYIKRSDSARTNLSIKGNLVFYSVCQVIFYVIAFRSRQLTDGKANLNYLESLQLSSLVSCFLNPLRVCLPSIVQAFAGITRAHQLAYCHTIIEKNSRKHLSTVYANANEKPDETLETYFPFDPCLLKRLKTKISPLYLEYNNTVEEHASSLAVMKRKRLVSGTQDADNDDYDFLNDNKKIKINEFTKNSDYKFNYLTYPGSK